MVHACVCTARCLCPCRKVCLTWFYNLAYTGFFVFLISCSGKHHSIMRTLPKKDRVIQEHVQRVTAWPSHLIGNAVVFISLPPRKGNQQPHFPKSRCNSSPIPLFVCAFLCSSKLNSKILPEAIQFLVLLLCIYVL